MGTCFTNILMIALSLGATTSVSRASTLVVNREPMSLQTKARLTHAKELLGGGYKKSAVRKSESTKDMTAFVRETTRKFLAKKYRKDSEKIAQAIIINAQKYELDPVFLMAVIQNESSFNPTRRGSFGEIGLMQIKPSVAEWISDVYDIDYEKDSDLLDPVMNIQLGAALMDKLRHQFESESRLYLSAYNIGAKKVRSMVSEQRTPKEYVVAVMKRYIAMYSAFKVKGNWKARGEIAFNNTKLAITKKFKNVAKNEVPTKVEVPAKIEAAPQVDSEALPVKADISAKSELAENTKS
jgi:soluble lytic murein transglycosylase